MPQHSCGSPIKAGAERASQSWWLDSASTARGDLRTIECSGRTRIGLQVDEKLDDLFLGYAGIQGYPQLSAKRFMGTQDGRDRYRNKCPATVVKSGSRPRVAKGMNGREPPEFSADRRFAQTQREAERLPEQSISGIQRPPVVRPLGLDADIVLSSSGQLGEEFVHAVHVR